jgi:hypothetical protein
VALAWLVTGRTVGGTALYPESNLLDRERALRLWTEANAWFSSEEGNRGAIMEGQLADLAVLSEDYFRVPDEAISKISSVLTLLGGKIVHGDAEYDDWAPPLPQPMPDWSPARQARQVIRLGPREYVASHACALHTKQRAPHREASELSRFWGTGCSCWAF